MRKLVLAMFISLDGYIEGPNKQLAGPAWSADLGKYWIDYNIDRAGATLYGRVCYEGMAAYWTSPAASANEAARLTALPKYVFSTTLKTVSWANTTIVSDDIAGAVNKLKAESGKDLMMFGGAGIANNVMRLGLVDEYRILVNNIVLGGGTPLFQGGYDRFGLELLDVQKFDSGAVLLSYKPNGK
jgi:dihydrofolate reductase